MIRSLAEALSAGDPRAAGAAAPTNDPAAQEQLAAAAHNVIALQLEDVELVAADAAESTATVRWRLSEFEVAVNSTKIILEWTESATGPRIVRVLPHSGALPLWLLERLDTRRTPDLMVSGGVGVDLEGLVSDAEQAQGRVQRMLPRWDGQLVIEAPSSQAVLATSLGAETENYDEIAAVATSSDGSADIDVGQRILINPGVYSAMEAAAARLVMTHEAVHVATRAPTVQVPTWWAEGLAEYVAFASTSRADAPYAKKLLANAGDQLATHLAADGQPIELPDASDFTGPAKSAAYESSRRACAVLSRLARQQRGKPTEATLEEFQASLAKGIGVDDSLQAVFGMTQRQFVAQWLAELRRPSTPLK